MQRTIKFERKNACPFQLSKCLYIRERKTDKQQRKRKMYRQRQVYRQKDSHTGRERRQERDTQSREVG